MADSSLRRTRSLATVPLTQPGHLITRVNSVPDFASQIRCSDRAKPAGLWSSWYRNRRDDELYDDYWDNKYHDVAMRAYQPDYNTYPHFSYTPGFFKGYSYYYANAGHTLPYLDSYYDRFMTRYNRSYLQNSKGLAYDKQLNMYRDGLVDYSNLDRYYMATNYYDRPYKSWDSLSNRSTYIPAYKERRSRAHYYWY